LEEIGEPQLGSERRGKQDWLAQAARLSNPRIEYHQSGNCKPEMGPANRAEQDRGRKVLQVSHNGRPNLSLGRPSIMLAGVQSQPTDWRVSRALPPASAASQWGLPGSRKSWPGV